MYRVLIVEDEEPMLDSYEFMLKSTDDFSCIGKARTGYEAIRQIHELEPDLVFIDINIPGVDGIAVIASVHGKFPVMDFVISTAYERFDLAQQAIPLGVFAYLVKPITKKTFFETLNKFREHYNTRLRNAAILSSLEEPADHFLPAGHQALNGGVPLSAAEQQFLRSTIWEPITEEQWEQYRQRFQLPSDKGIVCIMEPDDQDSSIGGIIAEKLSFKHYCLHDVVLSQDVFFISGDISRGNLEKQFLRILEEYAPAQIRRCGIGGLYRGPELYRSCEEARAEIRLKQDKSAALLRERLNLNRLRQKIGLSPPEEVKKLFDLLWGELFATYDFTLAKAKMIPVFMFLLDDYTAYFDDPAEDSPVPDIAGEIMSRRDIAEWKLWADKAFDTLLHQITLRRSGAFPLPLVLALEYVHEHYAERLQLSDAADKARVSPTYLSRLFSEHLKTTFIKYLTKLRIEKAGQLLRESRLSVKEISWAVGYEDPNYFGKLFRKVTGRLPHQFRDDGAAPGPKEGQ